MADPSTSGRSDVGEEADTADLAVSGEPVELPPDDERPDSDAEQPQDDVSLGFSRGDQLFLGVFLFSALVLMVFHWAHLSGWGLEPVEIERLERHRFDYQLDINSATWVEWLQLDGIGDVLARRIVEDRQQNGPFKRIEDIERVKGIGPKTLQRIRPWLRLEPPDEIRPDASARAN